jgi:osmoprotectant transport system substrate-binding protein
MHLSFVRRSIGASLSAAAVAAMAAACSLSTSTTTDAKPGSIAKDASLKGATFTVGSKEFTEQEILCHITSDALRSAGATVHEKCGLSGSDTVRTALTSGSIDMYWEYTGTGWISYLKQTKPITDPAQQFDAVAQQDLSRNHVKWLPAAPFNNTYALAVKTTVAQQLGVKTLSDYARLARTDPAKASLCVASEFVGRDDGLPGLEKTYGFKLPAAHLATLNEGAIYNSVAKSKPCNFGEAFVTDGRIKGLGLTVLDDDKHFFPVYNPALTIRESVYSAHPALTKVFAPISQALTTPVMQDLNTEVDVKGQDPADVAQTWMQGKGFIGK